MKKLLFTGVILLSTMTFAKTKDLQTIVKENLNQSISKNKETNDAGNIKKLRGMVTIEFDINCGGQIGHMTVSYMSDNSGGWGAVMEVANAINQGTTQGCQQMAGNGLI